MAARAIGSVLNIFRTGVTEPLQNQRMFRILRGPL